MRQCTPTVPPPQASAQRRWIVCTPDGAIVTMSSSRKVAVADCVRLLREGRPVLCYRQILAYTGSSVERMASERVAPGRVAPGWHVVAEKQVPVAPEVVANLLREEVTT